MRSASCALRYALREMRIAHLSDVHFGRISHPNIVDALLKELGEGRFNVVVVSGDLTQRARTSQYQAARQMLNAIRGPVVVLPGNHDVPAWYWPLERTQRPLKRYVKYIAQNLTPAFATPGLAVAGCNTAHGWTIKGGRVLRSDLERVEDFLKHQPPHFFRVLVVHHPLLRLPNAPTDEVAKGTQAALDLVVRQNVRLLLWGHLHRSHARAITIPETNHKVVVACAGTATSSRGREAGANRKANYYNHIQIESEQITIDERRYIPEKNHFQSERITTYNL